MIYSKSSVDLLPLLSRF